jgi:hypothetical protein
MRRTYTDIGDTDTEVIKTLTAISKVSAKMERNLSYSPTKDNPRKEEDFMSKMNEI